MNKLTQMLTDAANILFDDTQNELRALPKTVRLQLLIVLSGVWCVWGCGGWVGVVGGGEGGGGRGGGGCPVWGVPRGGTGPRRAVRADPEDLAPGGHPEGYGVRRRRSPPVQLVNVSLRRFVNP